MVDHSLFWDCASIGVQLGLGWLPDGAVAATDPSIVEDIVVANNIVHDVCTDYPSGCGIFASSVRNCSILHNHVYNLPYTGISMGWGWGIYVSFASGNSISGNRVHDVSSMLADAGCIYNTGQGYDATLSENYCSAMLTPYFSVLYMDQGSKNWAVFNNVSAHGAALYWFIARELNVHAYWNFSDISAVWDGEPEHLRLHLGGGNR